MRKKKKNMKIVVKRHGYSTIAWIGMLFDILFLVLMVVVGALTIEDYMKEEKVFPDFAVLFGFWFLIFIIGFIYFYDIYYFTIETYEDRYEIVRLFRRKKTYYFKDLTAKDYSWGKKYYVGKRKVMHISYIMENGIDAIFAYKVYIESINERKIA